jgi:hypothetical protein
MQVFRESPINSRKEAIFIFSAVFFIPAAIVAPSLVLVLNVGVACSVSAGWPLASSLFMMSTISTMVLGTTYASGILMTKPRSSLVRSRVRVYACLSSLIVLAASPLFIFLLETFVQVVSWLPHGLLTVVALFMYPVTASLLGHLTIERSMQSNPENGRGFPVEVAGNARPTKAVRWFVNRP